jgi:hypothetical protein
MVKAVLRLALATVVLTLAAMSTPKLAFADGCVEMLWNPSTGTVCHRVDGSRCTHCKYYCDDGSYHWWNTCAFE